MKTVRCSDKPLPCEGSALHDFNALGGIGRAESAALSAVCAVNVHKRLVRRTKEHSPWRPCQWSGFARLA